MAKIEDYWLYDPIYEAILECLSAYWIDQPEESEVKVQLEFTHANGEKQLKQFYWRNPNYKQLKEEYKNGETE